MSAYAEVLLRHKFRPFQRRMVTDALRNRRTFLLGSRQIGKTYSLSYLAVMLAGGVKWHDVNIPSHDVMIISATLEKAQKVIRDVQHHLDREAIEHDIQADELGSLTRVVLRNGAYIHATPGKPTSLQSFTGSVLVDELSITMHDPEEMIAQALSVSSSAPHFRVILCTNADEPESFVDRFLNDAEMAERRAMFAVQNVTIHDVYPEGLPPHIDELRRAMAPHLWGRFFENQFLAGGDLWFGGHWGQTTAGFSTVRQGTFGELPRIEWGADGLRVMSVDIGWVNHPSAIVFAQIAPSGITVRGEMLGYGVPYADQLRQLVELYRASGCSRLLIDAGGAAQLRNDLTQRLGTAVAGLS